MCLANECILHPWYGGCLVVWLLRGRYGRVGCGLVRRGGRIGVLGEEEDVKGRVPTREENDDNNGMIYKKTQSRGEAVEFVSIIIQ